MKNIVNRHALVCLLRETLGMGLKDVLLGFSNDAGIARIFAEPFDKFRGISPTKTLFLLIGAILRDKS